MSLKTAPAVTLMADSPHDLSTDLEPMIAEAKIPGLVAVVLHGNRIVAQGAAGVRKADSMERVQLGDSFQIASCTKAMTATLTAMLIEEGKLRWDTPIAEIFTDATRHIDPTWKHITVLELLNHRSGVVDDNLLFARSIIGLRRSRPAQRLAFAKQVLARPTRVSPDTRHVYSNANYLLLGAVLEKVSGTSWEHLIQQKLFAPLGIASGGFGPPGTPHHIDQPWGHGTRRWGVVPLPGKTVIALDPGSWSADWPLAYGPAGAVHMTVPDWAKFAVLHLRGDSANPHHEAALITAESFAVLHQPEASIGYAPGWQTATRTWARGPRTGDTGRVLMHQGDNGRWNCVVWIAPEIDFAMLIACNRASMWAQCDQIARALLRFAPKSDAHKSPVALSAIHSDPSWDDGVRVRTVD